MPPTGPRRHLLWLAAPLALLLAACAGAAASTSIEVTDARIPLPAGPNGAAYMTLVNAGDGDARLISAATDVAESAELHESSMQDGTMSMEEVDGVDIPAGGQAVLEPGGLHIMLLGVDQDLAEGDTVELTLTFEGADEQVVSAEVTPLAEGGTGGTSEDPMDSHSEHSMDSHSEMEMGSEG